MFEFLAPAGQYLAPYLSEIATALIACSLVIFGGEINSSLRKLLRSQNFVVRTVVFILINAFGYGLIIVKATPYLTKTLSQLPYGTMFTIVMASFIVIGLWAQRNRQI
ncbi:hypothetical protein VII00023_06994 [Vibrio ichthyoenteri ATCC 700023]|uniref:DUF3392 domain-containing protein n=1 Tax=Vibrio ichthyoenteri ATCC 700023 TaxID=870968 RepID=F9S3T8_9VIBR|nr:DUF3392 domain-containing protein [Vibrio ichthyoenteri]EGU37671.1 hypothetical protein VII00023_06994 [Vibrio ichthyoenteri ATCC 700023]